LPLRRFFEPLRRFFEPLRRFLELQRLPLLRQLPLRLMLLRLVPLRFLLLRFVPLRFLLPLRFFEPRNLPFESRRGLFLVELVEPLDELVVDPDEPICLFISCNIN
jgi:hypothetical protein